MVLRLAFAWFPRARMVHALLFVCLLAGLSARGQEAASHTLLIKVHDEANLPVAKAQITLHVNGIAVWSGATNDRGEVNISGREFPDFELSVSKKGYEAVVGRKIALEGQIVEVEVTLLHKLQVKETVTVKAGQTPTASTAEELQRAEIKQLPNRPANIADAVVFTPGVVLSPEGLVIAGGDEKHNALIVNSVDSTDPATGQFGLLVPVDSVETLSVAATPFLAQYGNFTSGVVSADTRRGGEKWNFELNDPLPEFRIRSGHLQGLRSTTPNVSFGGPVLAQKLYFSQTAQYLLDKNPVLTLPFPFNETKTRGGNFFSQLDLVVSPSHTLTGTIHITPQDTQFAHLDFFNPQRVTPNVDGTATAVTIIDRLKLGGGVLQSTVARQTFRVAVTPQGAAEMNITPLGNSGNYFNSQDRRSSRTVWIESYTLRPLNFKGTHNFQFGTSTTFSGDNGEFLAHPVNIEDQAGHVLKRIAFTGGQKFSRPDFEIAAFAQDHWALNPILSLDGGVRLDQQHVTGTLRYAPRMGLAWKPFGKNKSTTIRGGAGVFFDHVPLNVYAFRHYPEQVVTTFDALGNVLDGPRTFLNVIDRSGTRFRLVDRDKASSQEGRFAPYSMASSIELEQRLNRLVRVQVKYTYRDSYGLVTISPQVLTTGQNALVMQDGGSSRYREFQFSARIAEERKRKVFVSYVHSSIRGSLDAVSSYAGDVAFPVVRPSFFTSLSGDVPNRVLVWGETPLKWKMKIMPLMEYRTGFPYAVTDVLQNFVGVPNSNRFPGYFSLDARVSKDFQITPKYAGRLSVRALNLTNHFNALVVRSNIADPQFGTFFGSYGRRFKLDFDVLF